MDAQAYIAERMPLFDRWLDDLVPPADEPPETLHGAMRHLLFTSGKRLRPALAMAAAEAVGAPPDVALPAAGAVELIHTYSLIHDDLPCMDDDDVRRGVPSVHVAYDEATAVLAGDALLTLAFEAAARADARVAGALVRDLARASGSRGLVGGQVDDIGAAALDSSSSLAELESIHARKSAELIAVSVVGGARLAGATVLQLERLRSFGVFAGIAFQICDDRLDGDGVAALLGDEPSADRAENLLARALEPVEDLGERAEPLRELARFCARRDR